MLVGGAWRPASGTLPIEDPSTGSEIGRLGRGMAADIDEAVAAAEAARQGEWGRMTATERGRILARIGQMVLARIDDLAAIEATDVGKPLKQARADAVALARYMEFYAGAADKLMGETIPYLDGYTVYTLREPHGVTGHIVPWNYPMQIVGRSVGAALAMGNACVLKPAEEASLTALAFARIATEAGLPPGALNVVPGLGEEAGAALSAHPGVHHLSFTGSVAVGSLIQAAAAGNIVPVTLELGRQVAAGGLCRCRSRRRAAVPRQRGHPECRPDLLRLLAHPCRTKPLRRSGRADGGALPHAESRTGARRSRCRPAHLRPPEGDRRGLSRHGPR